MRVYRIAFAVAAIENRQSEITMDHVCISIPSVSRERTVELAVTIDGQKRLVNYRVVTCDWTKGGTDTEHRMDTLRAFIRDFETQWELVQIGTPTPENLVPVMFRQHYREGA